jgi:hypothetical protein
MKMRSRTRRFSDGPLGILGRLWAGVGRIAPAIASLSCLAACSAAYAQVDTQRVARVVLLQGEPFSQVQLAELRGTVPNEIVQRRIDEGWHVQEHANRLFVIAPGLWQGKQVERLMALYRELSIAVGADGLVDVRLGSSLREFTEGAFGVDPSVSDFALQMVVDLTVTDGTSDRSLRLTGAPTPGLAARLASKPLKGRPVGLPHPGAGSEMESRVSEFAPARPISVHVHSWGTLAHTATERAEDLAMGTRIVANHFGRAREEYRIVAAALARKVGADLMPMETLASGTPISQLPAELAKRLHAEVGPNYGRYGFSTAEEANRFLAGSRIRTMHVRFGMSAAFAESGGEPRILRYGFSRPVYFHHALRFPALLDMEVIRGPVKLTPRQEAIRGQPMHKHKGCSSIAQDIAVRTATPPEDQASLIICTCCLCAGC